LIGIISFLVTQYPLLLILPIIMALRVERQYVSRVATLTNTVSMFVAIAPFWNQTRSWLEISGISFFHAYLLLGLILGIVALISYVADQSLDSSFYAVTFVLYNSAFAGIVCLAAATMSAQNGAIIPFS
jgi:hypothetical protein